MDIFFYSFYSTAAESQHCDSAFEEQQQKKVFETDKHRFMRLKGFAEDSSHAIPGKQEKWIKSKYAFYWVEMWQSDATL